ncbi:MAG: AAA domain-containing protein [Saprospiraceae bacterium]
MRAICPYKAQAMLVDKVIAAQHIFKPKVKISCGTIHSFQGDECDIIINLYNPPLNISKSPQMFLNRKNILNVAVSRAKDYLFLLIPDEQTERVENLYQINRLLHIMRYYLAGVTKTWHSYDLEEQIFGQLDYIEKNTFATTHQSINVYTEPEKQFEIRTEEQAVDVQIRTEGAK